MMSTARKSPTALPSAHRLFMAFLFLMIAMISAMLWLRESHAIAQHKSASSSVIVVSTAPTMEPSK